MVKDLSCIKIHQPTYYVLISSPSPLLILVYLLVTTIDVLFVFSVLSPKWEAWTTATSPACRPSGQSSSPRGRPCNPWRGHLGVYQWRVLGWKQGPAREWHWETLLPESFEAPGNNAAGQQSKEGSEASHWRSWKRYTLANLEGLQHPCCKHS